MRQYRIIRHPAVDKDLSDIVELIAEYAGTAVAIRKLAEIESTVRSLSQTPHNGSIRDEIYPGLRAIPTARKGVVCFLVDDETETVQIVAITYAGAEWGLRILERNLP